MAAANPTADPQPPPRLSKSQFATGVEIGFVAVATAIGTWLRLSQIAARSFWVDEGSSVAIARLDWWNFLRLLWRREANMSFYYLLLRGWLHLGASEAWIRGLSVLFGVLAIPAIYFLARKIWGTTGAVMAAALLTVNAYHIRYSDEARGYSLAVLMVILSSNALLILLERPTKRARWVYVASSALAVYAHFYSLLVLTTQWMWLRSRQVERDKLEEARRAARALVIAISPVFLFLLTTGAGPLAWLPRPGWRILWQFALYFSGGGADLLGLHALCVLAALLLPQESPVAQRQLWLFVLWLFLPIAAVFAVSWIKPLFLPRFLLVSLPAWCLLAAGGIAKMRPRLFGIVIGTLLIALSLPAVERLYAAGLDQPNEDWRSATAYVLQRSQATDTAIFYGSQCRMPFDFYATGASNAPRAIFPAHGDRLTYMDFMGKPSQELLATTHQQAGRLWLVMCHNELPGGGYDVATRSLRTSLQSQLRLASSASFPGIQIEKYSGAKAD